MEPITYHRAGLSDIETLIEQRIDFLKEYMPETTDDKVVALRHLLDEYYREAIPSEQCLYWLAECDGRSAGGAGLAVRKHAPQYALTNGLTAYVFNVFTYPDYRHRGIAKELMTRLVDEAQRLNIRRVELHATEMGRPLYEKLGFKPPKDMVLEYYGCDKK